MKFEMFKIHSNARSSRWRFFSLGHICDQYIDFGLVCLYQTDVLFCLSNASLEKCFVTFSHNLCHEKSDLIKFQRSFPTSFMIVFQHSDELQIYLISSQISILGFSKISLRLTSDHESLSAHVYSVRSLVLCKYLSSVIDCIDIFIC